MRALAVLVSYVFHPLWTPLLVLGLLWSVDPWLRMQPAVMTYVASVMLINAVAPAVSLYVLHRRGVLCLPDFIANAGGVICASVEYHGGTQAGAIQTIEEKIRANTEAVLAVVERENRTPRDAAVSMAAERVRSAMAMRRWSSF